MLHNSLLTIFWYFGAFILFLSPLVILHELGHYLMAKWCGIPVKVFSIGYGKTLWSWTDASKTCWKIGMLPLGGYVQMEGDENVASSVSSLEHAPWKKIIIGLGGPLANYVTAGLLLAGLFALKGVPLYQASFSKIGLKNQKNSFFFQEKKGKKLEITKINGAPVGHAKEVSNMLNALSLGDSLTLRWKVFNSLCENQMSEKYLENEGVLRAVYQKNGDVSVQMMIENDEKGPQIFRTIAKPGEEKLKKNHHWGDVLKFDFSDRIMAYEKLNGQKILEKILSFMNPFLLFEKMNMSNMSGPIGILGQSGEIATMGIYAIIFFMAQLSIGLGMFNLLPLPILDGGMIFLSLIELIIRRPLPRRFQEIITMASLVILVGFFLFVSWQDLQRMALIKTFLSWLHFI